MLVVLFTLVTAVDQCQPYHAKPWWPTYHIVGNVTRGKDGLLPLLPAHINDANAIFQYKGVFHVMHQYGGSWGHLTSTDLVKWTRRDQVFNPPPPNSSWDKEAEVRSLHMARVLCCCVAMGGYRVYADVPYGTMLLVTSSLAVRRITEFPCWIRVSGSNSVIIRYDLL